jgi:hypothetical protein
VADAAAVMMEEFSMAMIVLVPGAAAVAWLVTLQGRVRAHDRQFREMRDDIVYIRQRIDRATQN